MRRTQRIRRTAILTLALASVLFTAGAGQAVAMERATDGDFGGNIVINLIERIGDFMSDFAVEVLDIFTKEGSEVSPDG